MHFPDPIVSMCLAGLLIETQATPATRSKVHADVEAMFVIQDSLVCPPFQ